MLLGGHDIIHKGVACLPALVSQSPHSVLVFSSCLNVITGNHLIAQGVLLPYKMRVAYIRSTGNKQTNKKSVIKPRKIKVFLKQINFSYLIRERDVPTCSWTMPSYRFSFVIL